MLLNPNRTVKTRSFVSSKTKTATFTPAQYKFLYENQLDQIAIHKQNKLKSIISLLSHTGSGKTYVIVHGIIISLIELYPAENITMFICADRGCVEMPYIDFHASYNGQLVRCVDGTVKQIVVLDNEGLDADLKSTAPVILEEGIKPYYVIFVTNHKVYNTWNSEHQSNPTNPNNVIIDEIQSGFGCPSAACLMDDRGYTSPSYDPKWLSNLISQFLEQDVTVFGNSGTLTLSQQQLTAEGSIMFHMLPEMPKDKNTTAFVKAIDVGSDNSLAMQQVMNYIDNDMKTLEEIINQFLPDTWKKAETIGIELIRPAIMFKFAMSDSPTGVSMNEIITGKKTNISIYRDWLESNGADYAKSVSGYKVYDEYIGSNNKNYISHRLVTASDVIIKANDKRNSKKPLGIAVMNSGNMGWNIPKIKYVANLSIPGQQTVTIMQEQLFARGNRLLFNIFEHEKMAQKINKLNVSYEQRLVVAKYVAFMSTVKVFHMDCQLMRNAVVKFSKNTYTESEGLALYVNSITDNKAPIEVEVASIIENTVINSNANYSQQWFSYPMTVSFNVNQYNRTATTVTTSKLDTDEWDNVFSNAQTFINSF